MGERQHFRRAPPFGGRPRVGLKAPVNDRCDDAERLPI